jgi:hypothetical protein
MDSNWAVKLAGSMVELTAVWRECWWARRQVATMVLLLDKLLVVMMDSKRVELTESSSVCCLAELKVLMRVDS